MEIYVRTGSKREMSVKLDFCINAVPQHKQDERCRVSCKRHWVLLALWSGAGQKLPLAASSGIRGGHMLAPCLPPKAPGVLRSVQLVTKRVKVRGSPVALTTNDPQWTGCCLSHNVSNPLFILRFVHKVLHIKIWNVLVTFHCHGETPGLS